MVRGVSGRTRACRNSVSLRHFRRALCRTGLQLNLGIGVALVEACATLREIRGRERGWRAGQRASDRLTPIIFLLYLACLMGAQASAPVID